MQQNNIVLISFYELDSFSVRILHTILKKAGFAVTSIFFKRLNMNNTMNRPTTAEIDALIELIKERQPLFVGISLRSPFFKLAAQITSAIKKRLKGLVVWGGVHAIIRPAQCIEFADIVCIGEGEEAILELANKLSNGEAIDRIRNLWIKQGNQIIKNDLRPLIQDLDAIPFPDFSNQDKFLVEDDAVLNLPAPEQRTSYWIMTSRGCPFNCTFCCNSVLRSVYKDKGKYVRRRSVDNVIQELVEAKKRFKNLADIAFEDDVFTFDVNWMRKFRDQYKAIFNIPFSCYCHPKATADEMIGLLKDAGVAKVTMGIQSGSEPFRHKYFKRYDTNREIVNAGNILAKHKVSCVYDVIMDNPLETNEDRRQTLNLLLQLPRPFELHTHTLTYFPEAQFTGLLLEKGVITENDVEDQREKSYERWTPTLDLQRSKENLFWDNLYYLARTGYVPRGFVLWLSRSSLLKNSPRILTLLLKLTSSNIHTVGRGSKISTIRWYLMSGIFRLPLLFRKKTWIFLWAKIKEKKVFKI
ncbi:B12-binding domain-containing radical SAM protein [Candidatus Omnitrophota bacterium]